MVAKIDKLHKNQTKKYKQFCRVGNKTEDCKLGYVLDVIKDAGGVAPYRQSDTQPVLERLWLHKIRKASLPQTVRKTGGFFSFSSCSNIRSRFLSKNRDGDSRSVSRYCINVRSKNQPTSTLSWHEILGISTVSFKKIEAHPQFVRRSAVALIPVRPTSPTRWSPPAHRRPRHPGPQKCRPPHPTRY